MASDPCGDVSGRSDRRGHNVADPEPAGGITYIPAVLETPRDPPGRAGGCGWSVLPPQLRPGRAAKLMDSCQVHWGLFSCVGSDVLLSSTERIEDTIPLCNATNTETSSSQSIRAYTLLSFTFISCHHQFSWVYVMFFPDLYLYFAV